MKNPRSQMVLRRRGFTLIEMLVVIAIIGILAGMVLPAVIIAKNKAKIQAAKSEMKNLQAAISTYESTYSRYPVTAQVIGGQLVDSTYGCPTSLPMLTGAMNPAVTVVRSNTDIIVALMDISFGANLNHIKNPQRQVFLNARQVGTNIFLPGVSTLDWQYRDPWGNPYIITLDLNYDNRCNDALYSLQAVAQQSDASGNYGLYNNQDQNQPGWPNNNYFQLNGPIMIWSLGPDGKAISTQKANTGLNKDNVLGWQ